MRRTVARERTSHENEITAFPIRADRSNKAEPLVAPLSTAFSLNALSRVQILPPLPIDRPILIYVARHRSVYVWPLRERKRRGHRPIRSSHSDFLRPFHRPTKIYDAR